MKLIATMGASGINQKHKYLINGNSYKSELSLHKLKMKIVKRIKRVVAIDLLHLLNILILQIWQGLLILSIKHF
jgi:hypothetical protein